MPFEDQPQTGALMAFYPLEKDWRNKHHVSKTKPCLSGSISTTDILERIGTLYAAEAEIRGQSPDVRCLTGQEKSRPLVEALREVLDAALRHLSPRSDMAKAIAYGTKRWPALSRFLGDDRLESTTTSRSARCAVSPLGAATGCSPALAQAARAPPPSTPSSRPARPMASTCRPTSPT
jgi:hypothetical protein